MNVKTINQTFSFEELSNNSLQQTYNNTRAMILYILILVIAFVFHLYYGRQDEMAFKRDTSFVWLVSHTYIEFM